MEKIKTLQFESVKVALKQNKDGYVLTLCIHPDDVPLELLRDFVGARYQVVMVRLNDEDQPIDRAAEFDGTKSVRLAGILCKENSPEKMADEVFNLLNNKKKYRKLQKGAVEWSESFSWERSRRMSLRLIKVIAGLN